MLCFSSRWVCNVISWLPCPYNTRFQPRTFLIPKTEQKKFHRSQTCHSITYLLEKNELRRIKSIDARLDFCEKMEWNIYAMKKNRVSQWRQLEFYISMTCNKYTEGSLFTFHVAILLSRIENHTYFHMCVWVCTEARWMFSSFFSHCQIPHMARHSRAYFQFTDNSLLITSNFIDSKRRMIETLENCKEFDVKFFFYRFLLNHFCNLLHSRRAWHSLFLVRLSKLFFSISFSEKKDMYFPHCLFYGAYCLLLIQFHTIHIRSRVRCNQFTTTTKYAFPWKCMKIETNMFNAMHARHQNPYKRQYVQSIQ